MAEHPPRCCRCGGPGQIPVRPHPGIAYCTTCYSGLVAGTVHLGQVFPVPA